MDKCWACCQSMRDWTWRGGLWKCQVLLQSNSTEGRIERTFWKKIHALQHWHDCLSPKPQLNLIRISGQTQEDYCLSTWTLSFLIGQQSPGARECSQNTATLHHAMPWGRAQEASCRRLGVPSSGKKFPWLLRHPKWVSGCWGCPRCWWCWAPLARQAPAFCTSIQAVVLSVKTVRIP